MFLYMCYVHVATYMPQTLRFVLEIIRDLQDLILYNFFTHVCIIFLHMHMPLVYGPAKRFSWCALLM